MKRIAALAGALCLILTVPVSADGDPAAGKAKSTVCSACHGADGNSVNPEWPSLAGQHPNYIVSQLKAYKDGTRVNPLMSAQAMTLDDSARADLAAFYAGQASTPRTADPQLVEAGKRLYRGGNTETGVSACIACHGPNGKGNPGGDGIPGIAGQHATYLAAQLRLYASGERRSDMNQMMRNVAAAMSDEEIEAVSSYMQGLR